MRKRSLQLLLSIYCLFITAVAMAQDNITIENKMRSDGKIYVVMAVCLTILIGFIVYVISIDRKIKKIEKQEQ